MTAGRGTPTSGPVSIRGPHKHTAAGKSVPWARITLVLALAALPTGISPDFTIKGAGTGLKRRFRPFPDCQASRRPQQSDQPAFPSEIVVKA